jgi:preprotein translocase subunit SecE
VIITRDDRVAAQQGNFISRIPTFIDQVRNEGRKIVWPTWGETLRTGIMVAILTTFLGVFFFVVDAGFGRLVRFLLSLAA